MKSQSLEQLLRELQGERTLSPMTDAEPEMCDKHPTARIKSIVSKVVNGDILVLGLCGHCTDMQEPTLVGRGWSVVREAVPT